MSTRTSLFIILIVFLLGGAAASYFFFFSPQEMVPGNQTGVEGDPFGNAGDIPSNGGSGQNNQGGSTNSNTENETGTIPFGTSTKKEALRKITDESVSGFSFAYIRKLISATSSRGEYSTTTYVRFVEKATGHVVEYTLDTGALRKLTTTRLPKNSESLFYANGERVVIRWFDGESKSIQSYDGKLPSLGLTMGELDGSFLPENISVVASDGKILFYGYKKDGIFSGFTRNGTIKDRKVMEHPFSDWLAQQIDDIVFLTTKPSFESLGVAYTLSLKTGDLVKVVGPEEALTSLSKKDGKEILFGGPQGDLSLFRSATKTNRLVPLRTIPEKCVWGNGTMILYCGVPREGSSFVGMPDRWYKGLTSFSDDLFMVDAYGEGVLTEEIGALQNIDIEKITISENGQYLLFTNKKDGALWIFDTTVTEEGVLY